MSSSSCQPLTFGHACTVCRRTTHRRLHGPIDSVGGGGGQRQLCSTYRPHSNRPPIDLCNQSRHLVRAHYSAPIDNARGPELLAFSCPRSLALTSAPVAHAAVAFWGACAAKCATRFPGTVRSAGYHAGSEAPRSQSTMRGVDSMGLQSRQPSSTARARLERPRWSAPAVTRKRL